MTRYGVLLPTFDPLRTGEPPQVAAAARRAEQLGFDCVWAGDHLACPAPVLDAPTCLAAAAAVTERIGLGLSVMLLGLRPPAWAAKQLATVQALSGGRLRLGVGVGGEFPAEFAAAEVTHAERGARLDRALTLLPALLRGEAVLDRGRPIGPLEPAVAMPPVLVGGRGEPALQRAARFGDAWLPMWLSPVTLARRAERLAELAAAAGRPRPRLALLLGVHLDADRTRARAQADAHLHGQYGMTIDRVERWTALGAAAEVSDILADYRAAGVQEFVLMPLGGRPLEQIERCSELLPVGMPA